MLLFHQRGPSPGKLAAILADNGYLTELRTAAVCALAAAKLAPRRVDCIGVVGTGVQARFQILLLRDVLRCRRVMVLTRAGSTAKGQLLGK